MAMPPARMASAVTSQRQSARKLLTALPNHRKCGGKAHRDQHHARNRSYTKDQQVSNGPMNISNRREDQQRHRRRTCESVNHSHHERPKILIHPDPAKGPVQPTQRSLVGRVGMELGLVRMWMAMDVVSVAMGMGVHLRSIGSAYWSARHRPEKCGHIYQAQNNQHYRDRQLHAEPDPHRYHKIKKNNSSADHENRNRVAKAPKGSNHRRPHAVALIADDGCDRDHVVRVCGVPHSQKKSHCENGEKADHVFDLLRRLLCERNFISRRARNPK